MMVVKHDRDGFVLGDPIDLGHALTAWENIREDVRAIRRAITEDGTMPAPGQSARGPAVKAFNEVVQPMARSAPARRNADQVPALLRKPATPQTGGAGGNANRRDAQATDATSQAVAAVRAANQVVQKVVAKPAARDGRGRFVRGGVGGEGRAPGAPGAGGGSGEDGNGEAGVMRSIADRIVGAVKESGAGMEEADPAVKAFNEVAQPMARGYELMTGGDKDKRQEGWLRRIYTSLTGFRRDETAFNKAANKSLKNIEERPEAKSGGEGGGMLGMMSGLLSKIPGVGPMLAGGAGMMGGIGKGLMGAGKGLLRRIPLLGALIGGVGAASDIYSSETDDSLTRRQKDERAGKAAGGFAGSIGGMLAGAKLGAMAGAIGGPIGVAIGGVLGGAVGMFFGDQAGQIIGDTVGGWVSDLREADIPGKIVGAWDATIDFLKKGWDGALEKLSDAWKGIKDAGSQAAQWASEKANAANNFIKDKTGVDVKGAAVAAKEKAVEVGAKAVEGAKAGVEYLGNNTTVGKGIKATGEAVRYGTDVAVDVAKSAKARITGKASENRDALVNQMAASGITDPKEQAMFMAQMDHESGGFTKMEERFNYRSADRLMAVSGSARKLGKPAIEAAMAQGPEAVAEAMYGGRMGNVNPGDAYAFRGRGHVQLTGRDNYTAAGKALGLDLANNPDLAAEPENAAKIAAWYWKRNPKLAAAARNGDVEGATQIINGGQNGVAHRKELYAQYSAEASTGNRPTAEASAIASASPMQSPVTVSAPSIKSLPVTSVAPIVASVKMPPLSVAPSAPALAEAPPVAVPLASNSDSKPVVIAAQSRDVGQDVRDRGIAHIVTGGLSA